MRGPKYIYIHNLLFLIDIQVLSWAPNFDSLD